MKKILIVAGLIALAIASWSVAGLLGAGGGGLKVVKRLFSDIAGVLLLIKEYGVAKVITGLISSTFLTQLATAGKIFFRYWWCNIIS